MKVEEYIPNFRSQAVIELDGWDSFHVCTETTTAWRDDNHSSEEVIVARTAELKAEWEAQAYARDRKAEYDALNQLELISDDDVNGTTTHKDAIAAIKAKWPKDNSGPV